MWLDTPASADELNLKDKRVESGCWLRSGFKSPSRQLCLKPLSGSNQIWILHKSDIINYVREGKGERERERERERKREGERERETERGRK